MKLYVVPGYDVYSFLITYSRFVADHGPPALVVSDRGSQLVKAGSLIGESAEPKAWDWEDISRKGAKSGTKWVFVEAGSQWRNGLVERQVGVLKRSMMSVLQARKDLSYPELETLFASVANLTNQRPLGVRLFNEDEYRSITPNDLLLGRNKLLLDPNSGFGDNDNLPRRFEVIKDL